MKVAVVSPAAQWTRSFVRFMKKRNIGWQMTAVSPARNSGIRNGAITR
jgi:hypothetical protein